MKPVLTFEGLLEWHVLSLYSERLCMTWANRCVSAAQKISNGHLTLFTRNVHHFQHTQSRSNLLVVDTWMNDWYPAFSSISFNISTSIWRCPENLGALKNHPFFYKWIFPFTKNHPFISRPGSAAGQVALGRPGGQRMCQEGRPDLCRGDVRWTNNHHQGWTVGGMEEIHGNNGRDTHGDSYIFHEFMRCCGMWMGYHGYQIWDERQILYGMLMGHTGI